MQIVELPREAHEEPDSEPRAAVLARVTCELPDDDKRVLFLTELSLGGAFILAMQMPALGTLLLLRIFPRAMQPLRTLEARVISLRLDPGDPERCGFGVAFVEIDDLQLEELSSAIASLACQRRVAPRIVDRLRAERRADPRLSTNLAAMVSIGDQVLPARVLNLSLNGAFVGLPGAATPPELTRGAEITLDLLHQRAPDSLRIRATVIRRSSAAEPPGFGIRFCELDTSDLRRVEGMILASLVEGEGFLDG